MQRGHSPVSIQNVNLCKGDLILLILGGGGGGRAHRLMQA